MLHNSTARETDMSFVVRRLDKRSGHTDRRAGSFANRLR